MMDIVLFLNIIKVILITIIIVLFGYQCVIEYNKYRERKGLARFSLKYEIQKFKWNRAMKNKKAMTANTIDFNTRMISHRIIEMIKDCVIAFLYSWKHFYMALTFNLRIKCKRIVLSDEFLFFKKDNKINERYFISLKTGQMLITSGNNLVDVCMYPGDINEVKKKLEKNTI